MDLIVSASSPEPIYAQIARQIAAQILRGDLAPGQGLPPIRTVARHLAVSVITVKKAWEELEHQGLITAQVGRGSFVADRHPTEFDDHRDSLAAQRISADVAYVRDLGLDLERVLELVRQAWRDAGAASQE
jgi:GntR family transcriptional regulator